MDLCGQRHDPARDIASSHAVSPYASARIVPGGRKIIAAMIDDPGSGSFAGNRGKSS